MDAPPAKTVDQGREEVTKLCRYFTTNREAFLAPGVKEAHVRQSLIDPLFEALGWDVRNKGMTAPQYREVVPEDSLDVEGHQKAPDYTFRVGSLAKFYAEAKKCGVNIASDPAPAFQLRRYGWSAKLALSILTDFEELGVYDCTMRPRPSEKASNARIQYFRFEEYPDRWRELWNVFSREAVWSGAFDQYAASKRKRGTSEVDEEFLKEMEGWRLALAGNIALRNKNLTLDDLNAAVQLTIDRVVFLRMAEDRGLEPYEQLLKLCERPEIYSRFIHDLSRRADQKYNSGLFHFQKESGVSEEPDRVTPKLVVDDKVFKPILQSLYFAYGSPYQFGVMPAEILGTVYERFLGKVIRLTAGHQAKIEEKPEVRKAGGVYYTPAYIVEYIVKHTVGLQVAARSPSQLAGSKDAQPFRVLDMACGSGSFLLGAYRCLLDYCLNWYVEHKPENFKKAVYKDPRDGHWRLTIEERKRILTTHIFGVDIDPQAVEVTKLSLLLKVLEGETDQSLSLSQLAFGDRALPNLADNIKCGNSLIGPGYFTGKMFPDPEEMKRVNAFDWKQGFPDAMNGGGFDCVIGNPPYIRIQTMKEWAPLEVEIYKGLFEAGKTGNYDIYVIFIEQGLMLLNSPGQLGFICPHKFFNSQYGEPVRAIIAGGKHLSHVVHFGDQQIFEGATTYTCLLFLSKLRSAECRILKVKDLTAWRSSGAGTEGAIEAKQVTESEWNFVLGKDASLFERLAKMPVKLGDVTSRIFQGPITSADTVYLFKDFKLNRKGTTTVVSAELGKPVLIESAILKQVIRSGSIGRYTAAPTALVLFPYEVEDCEAKLFSPKDMKEHFPLAWKYLNRNRDLLTGREGGKFNDPQWYRFGRTQNLGMWEQPKLMIPYMITELAAYLDREERFYFINVTTGGYGITTTDKAGSLEYLCALLNSRLLDFYFKRVTTTFHSGYFAANKQFIELLPIRQVDFTDARDRAAHGDIVNAADSMLRLHRQLATAKSTAQKAILQRQIEATDRQIDQLVYQLYGLTDEEVGLIEGRGNPPSDGR
jgi:hypothetical protein